MAYAHKTVNKMKFDLLTATPLFSSSLNTDLIGREKDNVSWHPLSSTRGGVIIFTKGFSGFVLSSL